VQTFKIRTETDPVSETLCLVASRILDDGHSPKNVIIPNVKKILRFYLRSLRGCNVGITGGDVYELRRWAQVPRHTYQVP
jgi:DNA-binding protein Fis